MLVSILKYLTVLTCERDIWHLSLLITAAWQSGTRWSRECSHVIIATSLLKKKLKNKKAFCQKKKKKQHGMVVSIILLILRSKKTLS